jgi:RES domain-containing protein
MPTVVWRICARRHTRRAFSGDGARRFGGRWNHRGTAVGYSAGTLSLAALELLVHLDLDTVPEDLVAISGRIPDGIAVEEISLRSLPRKWRSYPAPEELQDRGSEWLRFGRTAVLSVPSAVVPREWNYLLNPAYPDFAKIEIGKAEPFHLDPRLWRLDE